MEVSWGTLLAIVSILTVHTRSCYGGDYDYTETEDFTALQPRYAYKPPDQKCLEYRQANLENQKTILSLANLPNSHNYKPSEPIKVLPDGSVVIQNEVRTNLGNWLDWRECPKGMYVMGYLSYLIGTAEDDAGIYYVSFLCRMPGGNETNIIDACAPNLCTNGRPGNAGKRSKVCTGAIVGFALNVPEARRNGADVVGTKAFKGRCSVKLPTQVEIFGRALNQRDWTKYANCKKHQAMCGFQAQMQDYIPSRDNSAMNNLRIKCCQVPDPLKDCEPIEDRAFIRTCDNSESAEGLRCDFDSRVGLSLEHENEKALIFYSSIGYNFLSIKDEMKEKIILRLKNEQEYTLEYPWGNVTSNVVGPETSTLRTICLGPHESVELYQIVGQCGYFLVRTNLFVKIITEENGREYDEYFHV